MAQSRILKEVHETARGLHAAGVLSDMTMRDFDKVCLSPVHALGPEDIRQIRKRAHGHWFSVIGMTKCRRLAGKPR